MAKRKKLRTKGKILCAMDGTECGGICKKLHRTYSYVDKKGNEIVKDCPALDDRRDKRQRSDRE